MTVPVRYLSAGGETVDGQYVPVLWENLDDPIIAGREQLGHPKLYAQLPPPRHWNGKAYIRASWEDFPFAVLELSCEAVPTQELLSDIAASVGAGLIGHKYIPKTGHWDEADADYFTLMPMPGESNRRDPHPLPSMRAGRGSVKIDVPEWPEWQDMPTQYHIIRQLAALEQCAPTAAVIMDGATYADAFGQRILDRLRCPSKVFDARIVASPIYQGLRRRNIF